MTYQVDALIKLHRRITAEKRAGLDRHDQGSWGVAASHGPVEDVHFQDGGVKAMSRVTCLTSACAAGWAVVEAGDSMLVGGSGSAQLCITNDNQVESIPNRAQTLLGLTEEERHILFNGGASSLHTLNRIACIIRAAKHGRTWRDQVKHEAGAHRRAYR